MEGAICVERDRERPTAVVAGRQMLGVRNNIGSTRKKVTRIRRTERDSD